MQETTSTTAIRERRSFTVFEPFWFWL